MFGRQMVYKTKTLEFKIFGIDGKDEKYSGSIAEF